MKSHNIVMQHNDAIKLIHRYTTQ